MTNELILLNELRIGDIVGTTNRMVIACTKKAERIPDDSYAHWVALCHKDGEFHPYVVWNVIARPEGWSAQNGHYSFTLQEALKDYTKRGGEA